MLCPIKVKSNTIEHAAPFLLLHLDLLHVTWGRFHTLFVPYLRSMPNFCASKKFLKSWAYGANRARKTVHEIDPWSNPDLCYVNFEQSA